MVDGMSVVVNVMLCLTRVMRPPPLLGGISMRTVVKLCTLGSFFLRGEISFLNGDDTCMCVVKKQFVFNSVYVDLK